MSDAPDELAVHEREVRAYATGSADVILRRHLTAVLAEYDRRGVIVEPATALAEYWKTQYPTEYGHFPEQDRLTDALIAAVERSEQQ